MSHTRRELSPEDIQKVMATIDIPNCPATVSEAIREGRRTNLISYVLPKPSAAIQGCLQRR